jgi:hypothetical protein
MCTSPIDMHVDKDIDKERDKRTFLVPCRKCGECRNRRSKDWAFRLEHQVKVSDRVDFITLTYDTEHLRGSKNGFPVLVPRDVTLFLKKLRIEIVRNTNKYYDKEPKPIKYYICGEYGEKRGRPHYHAIIYNLPNDYVKRVKLLQKAWEHGMVWIDKNMIGPGAINYVTGYVHKHSPTYKKAKHVRLEDDRYYIQPEAVDEETGEIKYYTMKKEYREFNRQSFHLGLNYITPGIIKYHKEKKSTYVEAGNNSYMVPKYYHKYLWTELEMEKVRNKSQKHQDKQFKDKFNNNFTNLYAWRKEKQKQYLRKLQVKNRSGIFE